ncbi:MAG TPA: hypothetical protein VG942_03095 [Hyphomonadaceae bacterium]|nr:hypothetical protein [Hyphomonadaceae bacterium]
MVMTQEEERPDGLNLAERIRRLANGRTTLDVAQFQFIGLEQIRQRYGPRWTVKREKVQQVARNFISKRCSPEDVLIPGADGFLLVFGSRTGMTADTAAQRISTELNTFFLGAADMDDVAFEAHHRSMSVDDFAQAFGDLIAESHDAPPAPARGQETPIGYTPVWDAKRQALTTFFVTPLDAVTGHPLDWDNSSHRHINMDEMKLKASEDALRQIHASGKKALIGVALHVTSLNNQHNLARLFSVMASFDKELAKFRVLRVSGVEPGFPRIYLEDVIRTLKSRIPNIALGFNWMEPDVSSALKLGPSAIGFSLAPGALGPHAPRAELFARIRSAVEVARHYGVPVGVEGDIPPDQVQRFAMDGLTHVASPRIWPVIKDLPNAGGWPISRLSQVVKCA